MSRSAHVLSAVLLLGLASPSFADPKEKAVLKTGATALAVSPDAKTLITAAARDGKYILWDLETQKESKTLEAPNASLFRLAFSPDGKRLATMGSGMGATSVQLWEMPEARLLANVKGPKGVGFYGVAFTPDSKMLITGDDFELRFWSSTAGKLVKMATSGAIPLAVSPDGKAVAAAAGIQIKIWNIATARPLATFAIKARPRAIAYTPDGKSLITLDNLAKTATIWDLQTRKPRGTLQFTAEPWSMAVAPDGRTLAVGFWFDVDKAELWDLETRKCTASFKLGHQGAPAIAFANEGKTLITGGSAVKIWELGE